MTEQDRAARYSDLFGSDHQHASDCAFCPICATIAVVRNTKPEVLDHLASAARELIVAAGLLLEEAEEVVGRASEAGASRREGTTEPSGPAKVRRIDIG